jgi:hypothetical protein
VKKFRNLQHPSGNDLILEDVPNRQVDGFVPSKKFAGTSTKSTKKALLYKKRLPSTRYYLPTDYELYWQAQRYYTSSSFLFVFYCGVSSALMH